ncbi:SO_0444 family Cu/Zn efflux transporter [Aliikangiella sp. IMCC44653]
MEFIKHFTELFIESAPWLILGLLIAGFMQWIVPMSLLKQQLGNRSLSAIIKAAIIGAPLPLCSCGVIPAAIGLRRSGASKPATVSFLVATPETGVDSVSVSYALLGPFFAIMRPIAAIFSAIYTGILVKLFVKEENSSSNNSQSEQSCCDNDEPRAARLPLSKKITNSIEFASGKLLEDITFWLILGLLLAAAIKTWVPTDFLTQWGSGFIAMLVMALIGIPMYICATASTPIAAGFLAVGVSPGAVLVFLLAGPATNLSTMGMIRQEMGNKTLAVYLFSILSASISLGYLSDWLIQQFQLTYHQLAAQHHQMHESTLSIILALLLAGLMARNWYKQIKAKLSPKPKSSCCG